VKLTGAQILAMETPIPGKAKAPLRDLVEADLPAGLSLRIARLTRAIDAEFAAFGQIRMRLIKKWGTANAGGETVTIPIDKVHELNMEWGEALRQVVEIKDEIIHISEEEMGDLKISPLAILTLEPAVTFGKVEKKKLPKPKH